MGRLIVVLFMLACSLSGCLTVKRIEKNCDAFARVCLNSEIRIEWRDTAVIIRDTIRVPLPRDTVTIRDTVPVVGGIADMPPTTECFGLICASAGIYSGILTVSAWLADSSILVPRVDTVYIEKAIKEQTEINRVVVPEKNNLLFKILIYVVLIGLGLFMIRKVLK